MKLLTFTIYQYIIIFLSVLGIIGALRYGIIPTIPHIILTVILCIIIDGLFELVKTKKFIITQSSIITGLIIGEVLSPAQKFHIPILVSLLAITSKHFINFGKWHVFNPANFGLFIAMIIFSASNSWWTGSSGKLSIFLIIAFGVFLGYKMRNLQLLLAFFLTHFVIYSIFALIIQQGILNYALSINLYFMFFMIVEPMTTPKSKQGKIVYGILVAMLDFILFLLLPQYDNFIFALVIVNSFVPVINAVFKKYS